MTAFAKEIGFFVRVTPATLPASIVLPSMMAASNSFLPSAVNTAPLPALKSGLSSITRSPASTASTADPFASSTFAAAWIARSIPAR